MSSDTYDKIKELKIFWIEALLARNRELDHPHFMPHGLSAYSENEFTFKDGSFSIGEYNHYKKHGHLNAIMPAAEEKLTKREEIALRIYCSDKSTSMDIAFNLADLFIKESGK